VVAINDSVKHTLLNSNTSSSLSFRSDIGAEESGFHHSGLAPNGGEIFPRGIVFLDQVWNLL
jgi:hypothetical protein